jgi:hypothetical protein
MDYADVILGGAETKMDWKYLILVIGILVVVVIGGVMVWKMSSKESFESMDKTKKIMERAAEIQKDIDSCYYSLDCNNIDFCQKLDGVRTTCNENKYSTGTGKITYMDLMFLRPDYIQRLKNVNDRVLNFTCNFECVNGVQTPIKRNTVNNERIA